MLFGTIFKLTLHAMVSMESFINYQSVLARGSIKVEVLRPEKICSIERHHPTYVSLFFIPNSRHRDLNLGPLWLGEADRPTITLAGPASAAFSRFIFNLLTLL
jgi:hypothetical protein